MDSKRIIVLGMSSNRGGMESYAINLYREIIPYGYQFDFYLPHNAPETAYEKEILNLGGRFHRVGYGRTENMILHFKNMRKVLEEPNVIGVYINTCVLVDIDFLKVAKKMKKPVRIIHSHNSNYMSEMSKIAKLLEKKNKKNLDKYANMLFACSDLAGKWMFGRNRTYKLIHNGIDINKFKYDEKTRLRLRKELGIDNKLVIGTVGRIQYQKNPEFIVDLFAEIYRLNSNSVLLWAGDGDEAEVSRIKKRIAEKGLSKCVKLLGMVGNTNELYQAFDDFILPSRFEGLPFVLVEAQCSGLNCWTSTAVSGEANITGSVTYLPLELEPSQWALRILNSQKNDRMQSKIMVSKNGYSISETAKVVAGMLDSLL